MQRCRVATMFVALLVFSGLTTAAEKDDDQYINVDIKGILKTGIVAVGGETTGITITVKAKGDLDIIWELDLGNKMELMTLAKKLDNKTALVTGSYHKKKGVEIRERHIVKVKSLKEPVGK